MNSSCGAKTIINFTSDQIGTVLLEEENKRRASLKPSISKETWKQFPRPDLFIGRAGSAAQNVALSPLKLSLWPCLSARSKAPLSLTRLRNGRRVYQLYTPHAR